MKNDYTARIPRGLGYVPLDVADLARRRTEPFLDHVGLNRPIAFLLQEAYLQGIRDAVEAGEREARHG